MKKLYLFMPTLVLILSTLSAATFAKSLEIALETESIRVEYSEISKTGFVTPNNCEQCTKKVYHFNSIPKIKRRGKEVSFERFLGDYWNAKTATLFLDPETLTLRRINY
jgi:hypothetical protein